ncbi:MAG: 6-bladed beta-propeller [Bacteroidales bacterium]|nr:6-bladed beta-propeller [Bacteroidales bacterium]
MKKFRLSNVVLFFILLISLSCSRGGNLKEFNLHDISKNEDCKTIPLDSIVAGTEVIELDNSEDAPIIGAITGLYESDSSFFIVSDKKSIYEYNKKGKYIRQLASQGRGPGEYLSVGGVSVNNDDRSIAVFDFPSQRILKYDKDGNHISSFKPKFEDTLLYLKSFFPYKDGLLFYSSNNSARVDMFLFNQEDEIMEPVSRKDRNMLPEELILGNLFIFGDKQGPYIYNYFNDTVFVVKNKKLIPAWLTRSGNLRIGYDELFMDRLGNLGRSVLNMRNVIQGGNIVFFMYSLSDNIERKRIPFLSLYNIQTNSYTQNVEIRDKKDSLLTIGRRDLMFQGNTIKDIIVIKGLPGSDKNQVIIKFKML